MRNIIALTSFFLSGFAALVCEVAWIRKSSLVFGSTTFAVSTVLAVFFLGLACGSYLFGRISRRSSRPLRVYAALEIGVGLLASASLYFLNVAEVLYGTVFQLFADRTLVLFTVRAVLIGIVLLPPTFLMGGTLPLFCRQYVTSDAGIARVVGLLYGVNTLGAAVGGATAGFLLLPELGLSWSVHVAALLNILGGVIVWLLRFPAVPVPARAANRAQSPSGSGPAVISALFFLVGFVALGNEVLWTRFLGLLVRNTVYTYTLMLSMTLLGIVLGSVLASFLFDRSSVRALHFGTLQVLAALVILGLMTQGPEFWYAIENEFLALSLLLLPPAVLSGASFPLAVRMAAAGPAEASLVTGRMAALNTLGGIAGALLTGFLGLPLLGMQTSLLFLTFLGVATGSVAWLKLSGTPALRLRIPAVGGALILWLAIPFVREVRLPSDYLAYGKELVDYREGLGSNLAVIRKDDVLRLEIDRLWQGVNRKNHQAVAAHVPMLLHGNPRDALLVGVGAGQTPGRLLMYEVERVTCVDIEPMLFSFVRKHFDAAWMDDERVELVGADGRNYIVHSDRAYDVISVEIGQIFRPGAAFLYTEEFYRKTRERLGPGGVVSQYVPMPFFTPAQFRSVVSTFLEVFPQSLLWYNTSELLLLGFRDDRNTFGPQILDRLSGNEEVRRDLAYSHWGGEEHHLYRPEVFLSGFLAGPAGLHGLADGAPPYRDDRPVLDYETTGAHFGRIDDELAILEEIRAHLDPVDEVLGLQMTPGELDAVNTVREHNLGDIAASALIRKTQTMNVETDHAAMEDLLRQAAARNHESVYANRFLGRLLMQDERYGEAQDFLQKAVDLDPDHARTQHDLGTNSFQLGLLDKAVGHYSISFRLNPDVPELRNNFGLALARQGKLYQAAHHFEQALRLRPDYERARTNLLETRSMLLQREEQERQNGKP